MSLTTSMFRQLQSAAGPTMSQEQLIAIKKFLDDFYHKMHILQWEVLAGYVMMLLLSGGLLIYLRKNRRIALQGDANAARKAILPAFEPLLWIVLAVSSAFTIFFIIVLAVDAYPEGLKQSQAEGFVTGRNFIAMLVILFMYQKSLSIPALYRASFIGVILAAYPIPILMYMEGIETSGDDVIVFVYTFRGALVCFYLYIIAYPPARASKRVIREYCVFSIIYVSFVYIYSEYFRKREFGPGMNIVLVTVCWASLYPFFIWGVIKADTEHWRGLGQRACSLQSMLRQKKRMNERISSEGLHMLIEMHRKYIIDFAYLHMVKPIGTGATATVFKGLLHSKTEVAVKVYTPPEVTEEIIAEFSNEAALCGALQHPNIVSFIGMCVCPPNICLVSELCVASLADVLRVSSSQASQCATRKQLSVNISYMLDAARAIAYLHSFSPAFIHRDIKADNFLVDYNGVVKLTDFGESRTLPDMKPNTNNNTTSRKSHLAMLPEMVINMPENADAVDSTATPITNSALVPATPVAKRAVPPPGASCMTVRGTVDYMAPELMTGRAGKATYAEGADIYSLAITMWEIMNPNKEKYPSNGSHLKVYEWVMAGRRPPLDEDMHPGVRQLIESSWSPDEGLRPTAKDIVAILEEIQEEVQAPVASVLQKETPVRTKKNWKGKKYYNVFSGADSVSHMIDAGYVNSPAEAVRLGNSLMDAGLIHHAKHQRPFEENGSLYYFEEQKISDCMPIRESSTLSQAASSNESYGPKMSEKFERSRSGSDTTSVISTTYSQVSSSLYSTADGSHGNCACRKMAKGFDRPKASKAKLTASLGSSSRKSGAIIAKDNFLTNKLLPQVDEAEDANEFHAFHAF